MRMRRKKHREERLLRCDKYLIDPSGEIDLDEIFKRHAPLHIEIGCGKGGFITELAAQNPDINYLAVEKNLDVLVLAAEKAAEREIENLRFVPGDAEFLKCAKGKCDRIYLNFSDPWKKNCHAKRRLTHKRYLEIYKNVLKSGGELHFKTDNSALFEFSLNSFSDFGLRLKNITFDLHKSGFEGNIMTEYERLFSEQGNPIYRCEVIF